MKLEQKEIIKLMPNIILALNEAEKKQSLTENIFHKSEIKHRIEKFIEDITALLFNELIVSLEFGYKRVYDHSKVDVKNAKWYVQKKTNDFFHSFPFAFNQCSEFKNLNENLIAVLLRTSIEIQALINSPTYLGALEQIMANAFKIEPTYAIKWLDDIENVLFAAEKIKLELKSPIFWNKCYVWRHPKYRKFTISNEKEACNHYKEGTYWVMEGSRGDLTNSPHAIPGPNLKYFYPHREKYAEFSNLQVIFERFKKSF